MVESLSTETSRRCSYECRRILVLTVENFYPLKHGGFSAACRHCINARRKAKLLRARGRHAEGIHGASLGDVMEITRNVRAAIMRSDPDSVIENAFRQALYTVMHDFQKLDIIKRRASVKWVSAIFLDSDAPAPQLAASHASHRRRVGIGVCPSAT